MSNDNREQRRMNWVEFERNRMLALDEQRRIEEEEYFAEMQRASDEIAEMYDRIRRDFYSRKIELPGIKQSLTVKEWDNYLKTSAKDAWFEVRDKTLLAFTGFNMWRLTNGTMDVTDVDELLKMFKTYLDTDTRFAGDDIKSFLYDGVSSELSGFRRAVMTQLFKLAFSKGISEYLSLNKYHLNPFYCEY